MGVGLASEQRLLSENEYAQVKRSHYPELETLDQDQTLTLARWLRGERSRARDIISARRRARRGKAAATSGAGSPEASERGIAAKKQVFARALRRVNGRLERLRAQRRREEMRSNLKAALGRTQRARPHHPDPGRTPRRGMRPIGSGRGTAEVDPAQVGRVSQSVKEAQARRDNA
jgi:hypothetical protein